MGLVAADYALVQAQNYAAAAKADACAPGRLAPAAEIAPWSPIVETDEPAPLRLVRSSAVLHAELELTRLVARARTLRLSSPGARGPPSCRDELEGLRTPSLRDPGRCGPGRDPAGAERVRRGRGDGRVPDGGAMTGPAWAP